MDCKKTFLGLIFVLCFLVGCGKSSEHRFREGARPKVVTEALSGTANECGIWVNKNSPRESLVIGNDLSAMGALHVYNLKGKEVYRTPYLNRPVGVSIRYDIPLKNGEKIDVVACALASTNQIKIFKLDPQKKVLIDMTTEEGISSAFLSDTSDICLYKSRSSGNLFAFVCRNKKNDIHQIKLVENEKGKFSGTLVRKFGGRDQKSFIEGMVADDEYGYFYCSDEKHAILKYHADPTVRNNPLIKRFGLADQVPGSREGLGLYRQKSGKGYLVASSQIDSTFKIYERQGSNKYIKTASLYKVGQTDGIGLMAEAVLPDYPGGVIAVHNGIDNNFAFFDWYEFSKLK